MTARETAAKKAAVRRAWRAVAASVSADEPPLVAICSSCKRIRTTAGKWVKTAASRPAEELTHTLCPDCIRKLYPELER